MQGTRVEEKARARTNLMIKLRTFCEPLDLRVLLPPQHLMQCYLASYVILTSREEESTRHQPC
jgi:hypothetical protein